MDDKTLSKLREDLVKLLQAQGLDGPDSVTFLLLAAATIYAAMEDYHPEGFVDTADVAFKRVLRDRAGAN